MTKQEAVTNYISENYLDFNRLRHDVISDKLQVRCAHSLEYWREMTKQDINSIVCHCAQEYDVNITSREVMTALQSDLIPDVHPLREYIQSLPPYTPDQPDWIDFVASQVHVRESAQDRPAGCRSAAPVVFHNESTASNTSELQCSASETNYSEATHSSQCERSKTDRLWRICFKKWFVAMVASWMQDEVVNHQVLVLIGRQGIFKTTWLERLIPPHLRAFQTVNF